MKKKEKKNVWSQYQTLDIIIYDGMCLFYENISEELCRVILNNRVYLNPTKIDDKQVRKLDKWR